MSKEKIIFYIHNHVTSIPSGRSHACVETIFFFFSIQYFMQCTCSGFFPPQRIPSTQEIIWTSKLQRELSTATFLLVQDLWASAISPAIKCTIVSQNGIYCAYKIIFKKLTFSNISERLLPLFKSTLKLLRQPFSHQNMQSKWAVHMTWICYRNFPHQVTLSFFQNGSSS